MTPTLQQFLAKARQLSSRSGRTPAGGSLRQTLQDSLRAAGLPAHLPAGLDPALLARTGLSPLQPPLGDGARTPHPAPSAAIGPGEFLQGSHTHQQITRRYKLYVPSGRAARGRPPRALVVMLHGCTQDPDDFAAGTGMNQQAELHDVCVLYPEQCQSANASRCWNWFKHNHQQRGRGEAALLADLSRQIASQQGVEPGAVFIAGLSAGGAMAASVAAAYPEQFGGVGVHSGLPPGAADNLQEALAAMRSGAAGGAAAGVRGEPTRAGKGALPVPTIVFHGDQDTTVHPRNGQQVLAATLAPDAMAAPGHPEVTEGRADGGRRFTRTRFSRADGRPLAEHWLVHGAGHAWSGGQAAGSYTDPSGPDATAEMLRFFFSQRG